MRILVVGCGYLGLRAARRWVAGGCRVTALTRSPERARQLQEAGIDPVIGDVLEPGSLATLPAADVVLYAVGYDRGAGVEKRAVYVDGLRNVLTRMEGKLGRIVYISSSSVYGQEGGEWVDETSPAEPQSEGGAICLAAEDLLMRWADERSLPACILRMTGLYGPGRLLTRIEELRQGSPLAGVADAWLNLIQIDDAASAVLAVAAAPPQRQLYLVSDDRPVTRREYYRRLAALVGAPEPRFDPSRAARHGRGLNKRCRNDRFKSDYQVSWQYPTLEAGLPASLSEWDPAMR